MDSLANMSSFLRIMLPPDDPYETMLGFDGLNSTLLASMVSTIYNQSYNTSLYVNMLGVQCSQRGASWLHGVDGVQPELQLVK